MTSIGFVLIKANKYNMYRNTRKISGSKIVYQPKILFWFLNHDFIDQLS
jgi:hypothetical protein